MKREKVCPEEWRERLDRAVNAKRGRWRTLPRAISSSRAFAELSRSGLIVVLAMLDNLTYQGKSRKGRNGPQCCGLPLNDDGEFVVTNNELIARGLKSPDSIARGRREAWQLGFYDVVKPGSLMNYGIFRYSERWKNYPNGDYLPTDERLPGKSLYPRARAESNPTTESVVTTTTENVVKGDTDVTTENVVIEADPSTTDSVVNIIMYQENQTDPQVQNRDQVQDPDKRHSLTHRSDEADSKDNELLSAPIQHQWFIDSFSSACSEKGVEADLDLSPNLAAVLDEWITKRLSKKSYIGNKAIFDEKPHHIKEKINEIVLQWEFLEISYLGKSLQVPSIPSLEFLITNREAILGWINEQRQRSLDRIFARFETHEQEGTAVWS